tara:strand:- start:18084 stop:18419 length:336 start_codon:yes stop_codon:yes gene_type:complete
MAKTKKATKAKAKPKTTKKIEINIGGKSYKVDENVNETLAVMSNALQSHEIALLTWAYKDYAGNEPDLDSFRKSLNDYCLTIPNSEEIMKRMESLDKQAAEEQDKSKESKE